MRVVVTDVSVFFDLYQIECLPEFFALDWEIHTTDFVYNEILQAKQKEVFEVFRRSKQLKVISFSAEEELSVRDFRTKLRIRSIADKTILWKALQLKAMLLTCDSKLRQEAEAQSIEVHGSIWIIKKLIEKVVIEKHRGITLLEKLKITNQRLPISEIDKLIKSWKNK